MLTKRPIREEIERLQVAIAKRGNQIMAEALVGADQPPPVDTGLAASLAARRGTDDEARAVVSMAYVLAGMIDGLEMALGRRPRLVWLPAIASARVNRYAARSDSAICDVVPAERLLRVGQHWPNLGRFVGFLQSGSYGWSTRSSAQLTDHQRAFCRHYIANGGIASHAAKAAGYTDPGPEGRRLLRKRPIREEIE